MIKGENNQDNFSTREKVEAHLIFFKEKRGWTQGDVEEQLGLSPKYISKVKQGFSQGSEQLFSGLRLLKRVIELEKQLAEQPAPETLEQKVARLEQRLNRLDKFGGRVSYGEHQAVVQALNDAVSSATTDPAVAKAVELLTDALTRSQADARPDRSEPTTPAPAGSGATPREKH